MSLAGNILAQRAYFKVLRFKEEEGYALYLEAYSKGMTNVRTKISYTVLLLNRGEFQRARDILEPLLRYPFKDEKKERKKPKYEKYRSLIRLNLSLALWKLGDYEFALELLNRLEKNYPSITVYCAVGSILMEMGELKRAEEYTLKMLEEYDFDEPALLDNMAQIYFHMGESEKAFKYLKSALDKNPKQRDSHYFLALVYERQGELKQAADEALIARGCNYTALCAAHPQLVEELLLRLENLGALPDAAGSDI